mgnify:CR=1 FL=1
MAIVYEICRKKTGTATYSLTNKNGEEVVSKSIKVDYLVQVSDDGLLFSVSCKFTDESGKNAGISPPATCEAIVPVITYSTSQYEVTAWTEDATTVSPGSEPKPCVLPTGTLYSNPPVKNVGEEVIKFSQYESTFDIDDLMDRLYSVNDDVWYVDTRVSPIVHPLLNDVPARQAMIQEISYEDARVKLAVGYANCVRVVYTIGVRRWTLKGLDDTGDIAEMNPGWDQPRVRADTRFRDWSPPYAADGAVVPSANLGSWGHQQVYLRGSAHAQPGSPHDQNLQSGIPPYDVLKIQPQIDFSLFLR